jgi:hypothetical protein
MRQRGYELPHSAQVSNMARLFHEDTVLTLRRADPAHVYISKDTYNAKGHEGLENTEELVPITDL